MTSLPLTAPFAGVFIRRSVAYWVLLHMMRALILATAALSAKLPIHPADMIPGGNPLVVALAAGLGMLEARRRDEDLFLGNLGYGWPVMLLYLAFPAATLEAAFTVARFGWAMLAAYIGLPLAGLGALTGS